MELKYIVYITVNLRNGKLYVGVHKTNPDVFDGYIGCGIARKGDCIGNTPFHKAVRKYGYENFKRTTIAIFPNTEDGKLKAYSLEKQIVNETFLKSKNVYNLAEGGIGGKDPNVYKKVYMFDLKGQFLRSFKNAEKAAEFINNDDVYSATKAIRNNCLGTTQSSFGYFWSYQKKFTYSTNWKRQIAQYTLSGKFLRYFESITAAEVELSSNCIKQAIEKQSSAAGYQWRYYEGDCSDITPLKNYYTRYNKTPIIMFKTDGSELREYESVKNCVEQNPELVSTQINRVLKKIIKTHKGWCFKYKEQGDDIV